MIKNYLYNFSRKSMKLTNERMKGRQGTWGLEMKVLGLKYRARKQQTPRRRTMNLRSLDRGHNTTVGEGGFQSKDINLIRRRLGVFVIGSAQKGVYGIWVTGSTN